jgi:KaiC/GvpD/RAD55 family RecA-like ATPase
MRGPASHSSPRPTLLSAGFAHEQQWAEQRAVADAAAAAAAAANSDVPVADAPYSTVEGFIASVEAVLQAREAIDEARARLIYDRTSQWMHDRPKPQARKIADFQIKLRMNQWN